MAVEFKSLIIYNIIFGFYEDIGNRKIILKCYCVAFYLCFISFQVKYLNSFLKILCIEYTFYVVLALFSKKSRVTYFYKKLPVVDSLTCTKNIKTFYFGVNIAVTFVFLSVKTIDAYFISDGIYSRDFKRWFSVSLSAQCVLVGRLKFLLVILMLYYRIRIIRETLEKRGFGDTAQDRYTPMAYVEMYSAVLDWYESLDVPIKILLSTLLSTFFVETMCNVTVTIVVLKTEGWRCFKMFWTLVTVTQFCGGVLLPFALLDKTFDNIDRIRTLAIVKRNECSDERQRCEVGHLVLLLSHRRARGALWRGVRLSVRSLLTFVSFCVTAIIAVLQIKDQRNRRG